MGTRNSQSINATIPFAFLIIFAMPLSSVANDGVTQGPGSSFAGAADSVSELEEQTRNFLGPNAASDDKATAHAIIQRGMEQSAKGDSQAAEASFRTALYVDPSNADARYNLGVIAENKGDLSSALDFYQGALRTHPNDPELQEAVQAVQSKLKLGGGLAQNGAGPHGLSGKSPFASPESPFPGEQPSNVAKVPSNEGPFTNPESLSTQPSDWMKSPPPSSYPPAGQSPPTYYPMRTNNGNSNRQQQRTARRTVRRLVRMGLYLGRL